MTTFNEIQDNDLDSVAVIAPSSYVSKYVENKNYLIQDAGGNFTLPKRVIELRPADVNSWHGKTGVENRDRGSSIECYITNQLYDTGLTPEEQTYLEKLTGYNLKSSNPLTEPHPFYSSTVGKLRLENRTILLHLDNPLDYIKYKMCLKHPLVANSFDELDRSGSNIITHYIHSEEIEVSRLLNRTGKKERAEKHFSNANIRERRALYSYLTNEDTFVMNDEIVSGKLMEFRDKNIDKYLEASLLNKDFLKTNLMVVTGIARQHLRINAEGIHFEDKFVGKKHEDAVEYFNTVKNQEDLIKLTNKVTKKYIMTIDEMHYYVNEQLKIADNVNYQKLLIPQIDFVLNVAQDIYIKMSSFPNYNPNVKFEMGVRSRNNIHTLVVDSQLIDSNVSKTSDKHLPV